MKKATLVVLALVMALTLVMGSVSMVSAAAPVHQAFGGGLLANNRLPIGISFQARQLDADTGAAAGTFTWSISSQGNKILGKVLYLSVSDDGNNAWIGFVATHLVSEMENTEDFIGSEWVMEVQDDTNQISIPQFRSASEATLHEPMHLLNLKGQVTVR